MICPSTRAAALDQLAAFLPAVPLYGRDRNHVVPGHPAVSKLSPAIRHRLVTEDEVLRAVLHAHTSGRAGKFIQEIYWRRYWKAWLSLRPQIWSDYLADFAAVGTDDHLQVVRAIERGESGNPIIDHFSRELVDTGYLHNHARMWFAAWWVHEPRLPWQLGADFFHKHLLDGDPASNTLSWRWVAGLHTPGKSYLARRSNLEKHLAPELLDLLAAGLPAFENPQPFPTGFAGKPPIIRPEPTSPDFDSSAATGLWIHEEDLSPETSPLALLPFSAIIVTGNSSAWARHSFPPQKIQWLRDALADAATRASQQWKSEVATDLQDDLATSLVHWARSRGFGQIITLRPEVGPLGDLLPSISSALGTHGIHLALIDRPSDLELRPLATGGFFQFWENLQKQILVKHQSGR